MIEPKGVLVCNPAFFDVIDRKNPFMDPEKRIDRARALAQWQDVVGAFAASGLTVHEIEPLPQCEDMVFTANPAFTGFTSDGRLRAVAGRMRYPSRELEVVPQLEALRSLNYDIVTPPQGVQFEGGGDAVWHLGGKMLFLGIGPRSDAGAISLLEHAFGVEVVPLRLQIDRFYHLDTALSVLDKDVAVVYSRAFDADSYAELKRRFRHLVEVADDEANRMACNAARAGGNVVVIDASARATITNLRALGYDALPVDTSEFIKSGGSVYCMKQYLF
ncbi:MAG TPA: arginine deiminase-related protein [Candidatus Baltobacteraceae bacterium]|jgi:N-dimethylarginine dimethylaminohydrolase|nr:arginine deiminase-related protein [Candidatus Baltobacteraceae bacterium]